MAMKNFRLLFWDIFHFLLRILKGQHQHQVGARATRLHCRAALLIENMGLEQEVRGERREVGVQGGVGREALVLVEGRRGKGQ